MENNLENFVNIIENKNSKYISNEIVGVCKRINNSKRDFLFVNNFQGKHVPQNPSKIVEILDSLVKNIELNDEKILTIGFAETATAIGNYVSSKLNNCIYEMQTTREKIKEEFPIIEFKEEHSHAPEQLLYGNKDIFYNVDKVLFIEDEITTGKTIINFINEIKKINPNLKFSVASILNWQDEENEKIYKEAGIEVFYLIKGCLKYLTAKVDVKTLVEYESKEKNFDNISYIKVKNNLCTLKKTRMGRNPIKNIQFYSEYLINCAKNDSKILNKILKEENKEILVIGTEEFMYEPLLIAKYIEDFTNNKVFFHATTRSPIEVCDDKDYILNSRYKFVSCYDENRITYLYNLKKYDYVLILTDSVNGFEFKNQISNILCSLENDNNKIEMIEFGESDE